MNNTNGGLLQKSLSRVFQNNRLVLIAEILFLLLVGAFAILLHARLRIPLHIPGRQGLLFMAIIVAGRSFSRFGMAGTISCMGSAGILLFGLWGYHDPFMPLVYVTLGFIIDSLFLVFSFISSNIFIVALASGLSWTYVPVIRMIFSFFSGWQYDSLASGWIFPFFTHFAAGYLGGLAALASVYFISKRKT